MYVSIYVYMYVCYAAHKQIPYKYVDKYAEKFSIHLSNELCHFSKGFSINKQTNGQL